MPDNVNLLFEGLSRPIALIGSREVYDCFPKVFQSWVVREVEDARGRPILTLRRQGGRYHLEASWLRSPLRYRDKVDALCALVAEIVRARVQDPGLLCLHGAAAEFGGRLVVFPNQYRAGKSVLCACLAAAGVRIFTDDVLPIDGMEHHGIALGITPRLRLPLASDLSVETKAFIAKREGLCGHSYLYLDLSPEELAAHNTQTPIGAFVLLQRESGSETELRPVGRSEVLRRVIWQNFARESEAPEILERLYRIVDRAQCFRLRYGQADEAAVLLKGLFSSWAPTIETTEVVTGPETESTLATETHQSVVGSQYRRNPMVSEKSIEGECFLADSQGAAIHHLNGLGSALWHVLVDPMTIGQLVELLSVAFPEMALDRLRKEVTTFAAELSGKELLIAC